MLASIFLTQMRAHIDLVNGDCEEIQSSCPWTQIGCPETKVCKYLTLLKLRGDCILKGPTLKTNDNQGRFFREWPAHLRRCHDFPSPSPQRQIRLLVCKQEWCVVGREGVYQGILILKEICPGQILLAKICQQIFFAIVAKEIIEKKLCQKITNKYRKNRKSNKDFSSWLKTPVTNIAKTAKITNVTKLQTQKAKKPRRTRNVCKYRKSRKNKKDFSCQLKHP